MNDPSMQSFSSVSSAKLLKRRKHGTVHGLKVPTPDTHPSLGAEELQTTIDGARHALLEKQAADGYWVGELQGDSILESEYLLMKFILKQEDDPQLPRIANYLRGLQQPAGGWSLYPGGPCDLSATVKGYFALKLLSDDPQAPHMQAARRFVLQNGGAEQSNSFSRFFLAGLGQISYDACPAIPPEIALLPKWAYFNLYSVSAWTRTMILPLAITSAHRPVRDLPAAMGIRELFLQGPPHGVSNGDAPPDAEGWRQIFLALDQAMKVYEKLPFKPLRSKALKEAEQWLIEHMKGSEGLGAIFPPMVYILITLRALGYPDCHPLVEQAHAHLRGLFIEEGDSIRIQPCLSPVWDTGIALHALAESGLTSQDEPAQRSTAWLLGKECREPGDWAMHCPGVEPSGWFFEFANPWYPDVDDTAMVMMAMCRLGGDIAKQAIHRAVPWLLAMQNDDGGWAAFDRTRDRPILEHIPFADHNAMQDPSCPDITGRVLEGLGHCGFTIEHPAVQKAVAFIRSKQDSHGCWWGRWGVNYIYGTWQVLTGLRAVGEPMGQVYTRKAAAWLRHHQKPDGSWGESCETYDNPRLRGQGESTPSQTAWGMMGMLAACGPNDPAVRNGVRWLVENQRADGNWDENYYTGTGFPRVFYLKYHLYRLYFPLMALGRYRRLLGER